MACQKYAKACISPKDVELYLFGFSRGAFQAMLFADIISKIGIPQHEKRCGLLVLAWAFGLSEFAARYSERREVKINYVGLVDSVRSSIFRSNPRIPSGVLCQHAVAIHEARKFFQPRLDVSIDQKWFMGVHSDVGWGYNGCKYTKTLGKIVAEWILLSAVNTNWLAFKRLPKGLFSDSFTDMTLLMEAVWWIMHDPIRDPSNLFGCLRDVHRDVNMNALHKTAQVIKEVLKTVDIFTKERRDNFFLPLRSQRFLSGVCLDDETYFHEQMKTCEPHYSEIAMIFSKYGVRLGGMDEFDALIESARGKKYQTILKNREFVHDR